MNEEHSLTPYKYIKYKQKMYSALFSNSNKKAENKNVILKNISFYIYSFLIS